MTESCIFKLNNDVNHIIDLFHLREILYNDRVRIYENNNMRFSFYNKVVRVLLFKKNDNDLNKLYHYFYGEDNVNE